MTLKPGGATERPWFAINGGVDIVDRSGAMVAAVWAPGEDRGGVNAQANAALILAAVKTYDASDSEAYRKALEIIEKWFGEFPDTESKWPDGSPMSYGALFGTNGERDFMREVARKALAAGG